MSNSLGVYTIDKVRKKEGKQTLFEPWRIDLKRKYGVTNVEIINEVPSVENVCVLNVSVKVFRDWFFILEEGKPTLAFHKWLGGDGEPTDLYYKVIETIQSYARLGHTTDWIWEQVLTQFRKNVLGD